jgi:putative transposase
MIYVDLNPVRARMVNRPEAARHTSLRQRLAHQKAAASRATGPAPCWLLPIEELFPADRMNMRPISFREYLQLADAIGRRVGRRQHRGAIPSHLKPILERVGLCDCQMPDLIGQFGRLFHHVIGSPATLQRESERSGRNWRCRSASGASLYRASA